MTSSTTQTGATWGIDRVDQRTGLNGSYNYTADGAGTTAYIIDTGSYTAHAEFGGRASAGFDVIRDGRNGQDCHGHGTHVAGTAGGLTYGVAKAARLVSVRVMDCLGTAIWSGVIAGIDWVTANHIKPAVANMSLVGGYHTATNDAVNRSITSGVHYAVAAGNKNADACDFSPASAPRAITVAATTYDSGQDVRASYSNYGPCVDILDPGSTITSAWIGSPTATRTVSGTSMATPHVTGLIAQYLQVNPTATPATATATLKATAAQDVVGYAAGSPNLLARRWNGYLNGTGANSYHPDNSYWYQQNPGHVYGWLRGSAGSDPDLYLERWNGSSWVIVARSATTSLTEQLTYNAPGSSYYRLRIYSFSGAGSFDVWSNHPA